MTEKMICQIYEMAENIKKENLKKFNRQQQLDNIHKTMIKKYEDEDIAFIKKRFNHSLYKEVKNFLKEKKSEIFNKTGQMKEFSFTINFTFHLKVHNYTMFYGQDLVKKIINENIKNNNYNSPKIHVSHVNSKFVQITMGMIRKFFKLPPRIKVKVNFGLTADPEFMNNLLVQGESLMQKLEIQKETTNKISRKTPIL